MAFRHHLKDFTQQLQVWSFSAVMRLVWCCGFSITFSQTCLVQSYPSNLPFSHYCVENYTITPFSLQNSCGHSCKPQIGLRRIYVGLGTGIAEGSLEVK